MELQAGVAVRAPRAQRHSRGSATGSTASPSRTWDLRTGWVFASTTRSKASVRSADGGGPGRRRHRRRRGRCPGAWSCRLARREPRRRLRPRDHLDRRARRVQFLNPEHRAFEQRDRGRPSPSNSFRRPGVTIPPSHGPQLIDTTRHPVRRRASTCAVLFSHLVGSARVRRVARCGRGGPWSNLNSTSASSVLVREQVEDRPQPVHLRRASLVELRPLRSSMRLSASTPARGRPRYRAVLLALGGYVGRAALPSVMSTGK